MNNKRLKDKIAQYLNALHPSKYFHVIYKDKILVAKYFDRDERVELLQNRLIEKQSQFDDPRGYISFVLTEILKPLTGVTYVIFQVGDEEGEFVQFAIERHSMIMDFPILPGNRHLPYMKQTRKLLEDLGFTFTEGEITIKKYCYYHHKPKVADEFDTLNADFGRDNEAITEFVYRVFTEIFRKDPHELNVIVGTRESDLSKSIKQGKQILSSIISRYRSK